MEMFSQDPGLITTTLGYNLWPERTKTIYYPLYHVPNQESPSIDYKKFCTKKDMNVFLSVLPLL